MLQHHVHTSSRVLRSLPSSHSSISPARGVLACNHRAQQRYGRGACCTAPLTGWQALQSLRPDLRQRHAVVVASTKGGDSSSGGGTQSSKQQEQDEEPAAEEEGETFTRYCFEGLLSSALIVGAGNLLGGSGAWSWDAPADGLNTILTCALVPTLMLLAICLPTYPAGHATADTKFLEDVYKRSASLTIVVGDDDVRSRKLTLTPSMSLQSVSSALALVQVFLARPWSPSRPLPIAGFIIKQTMTQAALECLLRGTLVLGLQGVVRDAVAQADSSSWLFWIKFFGLANSTNSLAAAVLLATLLLTPFTLFQTKAVQEFARAAVNKPVRDQGLAVMTSSTSVSEFSQKLQALSQSLGAEPAALSALLADAPFPLASVASGKSERGSGSGSAAGGEASKEGAPSESAAAAIAESAQASVATQEGATTSRPLGSGSLAAGETSNVVGGTADAAGAAGGVVTAASGAGFNSKVVSKEAQKQLQRSEAETAAAFAALRAARTPEELEASSLALLDAASNSGEAALATLIESNIAKDDAEEQLSEKTVAAMASVQALRATQRRLKAAAAEAELASSEDLRVAEFDALTRVQTQEDRLVAWVLGTHLMSCMVAVNAAFLASGSLAVSFGTAWMVRVLPALVVEVTRQLRQDAMQGQGRA